MCNYGDIRLVGRSYDNEGTVEVCADNAWGTVCSDESDDADASVVCSQTVYSATGEKRELYFCKLHDATSLMCIYTPCR